MLTRRRALSALFVAPAAGLALSAVPRAAQAMEPSIFQRDGLAIGGTDPVAYFDLNGPVAGSSAHELVWQGATWRFATAGNLARFEADPDGYAPAFGGYCAWAASQGYLAPTVPEAWTVHEGRLYLNANLRIRRRFERDLEELIAQAEANWPSILG